jgi:hypothetical protein
MKNQNNHFKDSDFCKLLRLCVISALQISRKHFATFDFFVKTLNATTLIWLLKVTRFKERSDFVLKWKNAEAKFQNSKVNKRKFQCWQFIKIA